MLEEREEEATEEGMTDAPKTVPEIAVLAAEVDRLRAAVERVKALPRYVVSFRRGFDDDMSIYRDENGTWLDLDDVLAALDPEGE